VVVFGVGLLLYLTGSAQLAGQQQPLWLRLTVLGVACAAQTQRRRLPVAALLVVFCAFAVDGLLGFSVPVLIVLVDTLFAATLYSSHRWSRVAVRVNAVFVLGMTVGALVFIPDWGAAVQAVLGVFSAALVPVWWAMQVRHHREAALAERERAEQQARIAGHLSAIAIQSEAVLQADRDPATVRQVLHAVRENSVSALTEMRDDRTAPVGRRRRRARATHRARAAA
jgi:hypothetical protein